MRTKYSCAISFKICFCNIFQNIRVQYLSKLVCTTSLCSGCVHPVQFCSDNHHHWLPEEYPDHVSGHDDWRYYILPTYIAYISWWLEGTTSTAFSTSSGSTSASLEVLSTQKVSLDEICFCCFHQHFLFAVTFSTKKSSPLPTTTAGGEKTWKQTYVMNNKFLQTFVINFKIWTSI